MTDHTTTNTTFTTEADERLARLATKVRDLQASIAAAAACLQQVAVIYGWDMHDRGEISVPDGMKSISGRVALIGNAMMGPVD